MADLGPDLPLIRPMTQQAQFAQSYTNEQLFARLAGAFGLLAAVLVATGLYGTLSYRVSRRTSEIGIRLGLRVALVLALAVAGSRFLESMLFGLTARDPLTYVAALVAISVVAVVATLVPARRAISVDPMIALRTE
jgi:ABC-type antimicrobial peptide transport system permease subunit